MSQDTIQNSKIWRVGIFLAGVFRSEEKTRFVEGGLSCAPTTNVRCVLVVRRGLHTSTHVDRNGNTMIKGSSSNVPRAQLQEQTW
jgi:hypothetical protein